MPRVSSKILGEQYADYIMRNYRVGQSENILEQISNWIGLKKPYECLGITMKNFFPWINHQQKPWIAKYAKQHAQVLRENIDKQNPNWYPQQSFNLDTEEVSFDPWE